MKNTILAVGISMTICLCFLAAMSLNVISTTTAIPGTWNEHSVNNTCETSGYHNVIDEATSSVKTICGNINFCQATIDVNAATTAAHIANCDISSTNGYIVLNADTVGGTASGTTTIAYTVKGRGRRY